MSFIGIFEQGQPQPVSHPSYIGQPADNSLNLVDRLHIRQMERLLEHTLNELEQVKSRLSQLEKTMAERGEEGITACGSSEQLPPAPLTHSLPIAEIFKVAEIAKRLR